MLNKRYAQNQRSQSRGTVTKGSNFGIRGRNIQAKYEEKMEQNQYKYEF